MTRTLTALFDDQADAEAAKARLKASDIDVSRVHIHDRTSEGFSETAYSTGDDRGFWQKLTGMELPEEDRHTYEEGVRRGGVVLTAEVEADQAEAAARVLEEGSVDMDERTGAWRETGWDYQPVATGAALGTGAALAARPDFTDEADPARVDLARDDEERIPLVEERLAVGKREVDRGGVRVRSYVVETPVHEQVRLHNEQIAIERRPVDRELGAGEDAFRERTVEMTARGEEAVVSKTAHVREEVVVRKDASERTETIDDTVRRTEVEIDKDRDGLASERPIDRNRI